MKVGDKVKVVRSLIAERYGDGTSVFIGEVGTVKTPYMESLRGHLVVLDNMRDEGEYPFVPEELTIIEGATT